MSYYAKNPYEQPEPPRCLSCDELKVQAKVHSHTFWQCRNPACEECPPQYRVIECSNCGSEYTYGEFCKNCTDGAAVGYPEESIEDGYENWLAAQQSAEPTAESTGTSPGVSDVENSDAPF